MTFPAGAAERLLLVPVRRAEVDFFEPPLRVELVSLDPDFRAEDDLFLAAGFFEDDVVFDPLRRVDEALMAFEREVGAFDRFVIFLDEPELPARAVVRERLAFLLLLLADFRAFGLLRLLDDFELCADVLPREVDRAEVFFGIVLVRAADVRFFAFGINLLQKSQFTFIYYVLTIKVLETVDSL